MHAKTVPELCDLSVWRYRGEGNANIVLTYVGSNPKFRATVLRLRKVTKQDENTQPSGCIECCVRARSRKTSTQAFTLAYIQAVIVPLLGQEYVNESVLLRVSSSFLCELSKSIAPLRPMRRGHKDIDVSQEYAILTPDDTKFVSRSQPTLSIELKPKWGFLPASPYISNENDVKRRVCRYCMHQYLKLEKQNGIGQKSDYCPLDLFSMEEARVRKALTALLREPENNFRLFVGDVQVDTEEDGWRASLSDFLDVDPSSAVGQRHASEQRLIDLLTSTIIQERSFFNRLKQLQSSLDELDIDGIIQLPLIRDGGLPEPTLKDWQRAVGGYGKQFDSTTGRRKGRVGTIHRMSRGIFRVLNRRLRYADQGWMSLTEMSNEEQRQRIHEFLISATLKDCSVMLTFQRADDDDGDVTDAANCDRIFRETIKHVLVPRRSSTVGSTDKHERYNYKIAALDLDPKSVAKIPHYHFLDRNVVASFLEFGPENKRCVV